MKTLIAERVNPAGDILIEQGEIYGGIVATVWSSKKGYEEAAKRIVRACNSYEAMAHALNLCLTTVENSNNLWAIPSDVEKVMRDALKLAKGE